MCEVCLGHSSFASFEANDAPQKVMLTERRKAETSNGGNSDSLLCSDTIRYVILITRARHVITTIMR